MINLKQDLILKSIDGEYVYNIFSYNPNEEIMIVDILNRNLESLTTRKWKTDDFQKQIDSGTIIEFKEGKTIGE